MMKKITAVLGVFALSLAFAGTAAAAEDFSGPYQAEWLTKYGCTMADWQYEREGCISLTGGDAREWQAERAVELNANEEAWARIDAQSQRGGGDGGGAGGGGSGGGGGDGGGVPVCWSASLTPIPTRRDHPWALANCKSPLT